MKKRISGIITILFALVFVQALTANTVIVNPGQDIQTAIDSSSFNYTIFIKPGIYKTSRQITIQNKKQVMIIGLGSVKIICTDPNSRVIQIENSERIALNNLHLTHAPRAEGCAEGVLYIAHSDKIFVDKCVLDGCGVYGIDVQAVSHISIWRSEIKNNSWRGISIANCTEVEVIGNLIHDNQQAGSIEDCSKVKLMNNRIYNNRKENTLIMRRIRDI